MTIIVVYFLFFLFSLSIPFLFCFYFLFLKYFSILAILLSENAYKLFFSHRILFIIILRPNSMRSLGITGKFFAEFDMFAQPPTLRSRQQTETSSYTSGILSFGLALLFTYVFCIKFYKVLTYQNISSTETSTKLSGDQISADDVFFSVGLGMGHNLTLEQILPNFQFVVNVTLESGDFKVLDMVPCSIQSWSKMENYQTLYYQYKLDKTLCPNQTQDLNLKKQYYAPNSSYITISVSPCLNETKNTCNDLATQQKYVEYIKDFQGSIFLVVYLLDSIIDPAAENPVNYTVNTDSQFSFTIKRGIIGTMELASYHINTDKGIFPVQQYVQNEGYILNTFRETSMERDDQTANYALIYICMNRKKILIERVVGKIDDMLSYAGGLFSIIVGFLSFFMTSYNKYRYELMVAEGVFNSDENGNVIRENDFSFWKYIKYTIFDWVDLIFCKHLDWEDCKAIHEARQEANSHLDVTGLFRKIKHLQRSLHYALEQNEKNCLYLLKPQSLDKIRKDRLALEYYQYVLGEDAATTIDQYRTAQSLLQFSWKIHLKSLASKKTIDNKVTNGDAHETTPAQFEFGQELERRKNQTTDEIIDKFPEIVRAAEEITLPHEMHQIQSQLSAAFYNLTPEKRSQFQSNIPIKILVRLRRKNEEKLTEKSSSFESPHKFDKLGRMAPRTIRVISESYRGESSVSQFVRNQSGLFKY